MCCIPPTFNDLSIENRVTSLESIRNATFFGGIFETEGDVQPSLLEMQGWYMVGVLTVLRPIGSII